MPWRGPEFEGDFPSLGWVLADLIENDLRVPAGRRYQEPFRFTDRQLALFVRMHRVDPVTGRWVYRRTVKEGPKGDGKSPFAFACAYAHLVGPVLFDGWDADGEPVGRPHPTPLVQILALAEDQTDNCYMQGRAMLAESPAIDAHGIDLGLSRIRLLGRPGVIEPVSSAAGTREGQPTTFAVKEETQYWVPSKGGDRLDRVVSRNLAKNAGLSIAVTNSYRIGEESIAERDANDAAGGAAGLLYEAVRGSHVADADLTDPVLVRRSLDEAYDPQADWVPKDRLVEECADPAVPPGEARRFYFNLPDRFSKTWLPAGSWEPLGVPRFVPDGSEVVLGFDGSYNNDSTALVGCTVSDPYLFVLGVWERPWEWPGEWVVPRLEVEATIAEAFDRWRVVELAADPPGWHRELDVWRGRWGDEVVLDFPTNGAPKRMVAACSRFWTAVQTGAVTHDGSPLLARHLEHCTVKETGLGPVIVKEHKHSPHKIDAAVAAVIAYERATWRRGESDAGLAEEWFTAATWECRSCGRRNLTRDAACRGCGSRGDG